MLPRLDHFYTGFSYCGPCSNHVRLHSVCTKITSHGSLFCYLFITAQLFRDTTDIFALKLSWIVSWLALNNRLTKRDSCALWIMLNGSWEGVFREGEWNGASDCSVMSLASVSSDAMAWNILYPSPPPTPTPMWVGEVFPKSYKIISSHTSSYLNLLLKKRKCHFLEFTLTEILSQRKTQDTHIHTSSCEVSMEIEFHQVTDKVEAR